MALTVAQIATASSQDIRSQLPANSPILYDYVNRIHEQILRETKWRFLLSDPQQFDLTAGSAIYWIGATGEAPTGAIDTELNLSDVAYVKANSFRDLTAFGDVAATDVNPNGAWAANPGRPVEFSVSYPNAYTITLYPTPSQARTVDFRYYKVRKALSTGSDNLQIPDEYKDVIVAGVNFLACNFLKDAVSQGDMNTWASLFQNGLAAMKRDRTLYAMTPDFVRPDTTV